MAEDTRRRETTSRERPQRQRQGRSRSQEQRPRRWQRRVRRCHFCTEGISHIDYKDVEMLRRFLSDRGKIRPRRQTGTCARHQRRLTRAIKRARHLALLPFTADHVRTA